MSNLYAPDAEQAVLGAILVEPSLFPVVAEVVDENDFHEPTNGVIYATIRDLIGAGGIVDKVSVVEMIRRRGQLEKIGGPSRITELLDATPSAGNALYYAQEMKAAADRRALIGAARRIAKKAEDAETPAEAIAYAQDAVTKIRNDATLPHAVDMTTAHDLWKANAEQRAKRGLMTCFTKLDNFLGGMRPREMSVIAARPGVGKSAAIEQIAVASARQGFKTVLLPLEMGRDATFERIYRREDEYEIPNLYIGDNDTPMSADDIWAEAARLEAEVLLVDHLRHIDGWSATKAGESRDMPANRVLHRLHRMAASQKVCLIVAHQLGRDADGQTPTLSDLRDTGGLEEIAWRVMFLHRPHLNAKPDRKNNVPGDFEMHAIVAKNRSGPTGYVKLSWSGKDVTICDMPNAEFGVA